MANDTQSPRPHALDEEREAATRTPKKPWSKPCILRIEHGVLLKTGTGTTSHPTVEDTGYIANS